MDNNISPAIKFINAGAGAGKTTELVAIYCEHLLGGHIDRASGKLIEKEGRTPECCKPEELLLTTFTKAAAAEFKERIQKTLLINNRTDLIPGIENALIGTIDSICQHYLQKYWYLLEMSPEIAVKDEEAKSLLNGLLNDPDIAPDQKFFIDYARDMGITSNDNNKACPDFWKEKVIQLIEIMENYGLKIEALEQIRKNSLATVGHLFKEYANDRYAFFDFQEFEKSMTDFQDFCKGNSIKKPNTRATNFFKKEIQPLLEKKKNITPTDIESLYSEIYKIIKRDSGWFKELMAEYPAIWTQIYGAVGYRYHEKIQRCIQTVIDVAAKAYTQLEEYKRDRNLLQFSDLEKLFLKLLQEQEVENEIKNNIRYVLVDEFQDINPLQLKIYRKLSELTTKSYWVGDLKQAIFGFRNSDAELCQEAISQIKDTEYLTVSHRSLPTLVKQANNIFTYAFSKENLGNTSMESLSKRQIELQSWDKMEIAEKELNTKTSGKYIHEWRYSENNAIASGINTIITDENNPLHWVADKISGKCRAIKYGDIAILCRSNSKCRDLAEILENEGIPVSARPERILDFPEIRLILSMLGYVHDIDKELCIAEINKLWLDLDLTSNIRYFLEKGSLGQDGIPEIFKKLDQIRTTSYYNPVSETLREIIAAVDMKHIAAKWGSEQTRKSHIDQLLQYAQSFNHKDSPSDIFDFMEMLQQPYDEEISFDNSEDTVKITTYHKSKGLEWKTVILDDLDKDPITTKEKKILEKIHILIKPGTMPDLCYIPPMKALVRELIKRQIHDNPVFKYASNKEKAENIRLLYVGFTRAENHLVFLKKDKTELEFLNLLNSNRHILTDESIDVQELGNTPSRDIPAQHEQSVTVLKTAADIDRKTVQQRNITPSEAEDTPDQQLFTVGKLLETRHRITSPSSAECKFPQELGTCIHNFLAVFRWEGPGRITALHDWNLQKARQLVSNFGQPLDAGQMVDTAEDFHALMTGIYGPDIQFEREVPFVQELENGRQVNGEIDLIIKCKDFQIIVDYKNILSEPGEEASVKKQTMKYFRQLHYYRQAIGPDNVKEMYIFYPTLGKAAKIREEMNLKGNTGLQ